MVSSHKKFLKNFLGYGYGQLITIIIQFALVPFFILYWGVEKYSDWLILTGIPMLISVMDFGVSGALGSYGVMQLAKNNYKEALKSMHTSLTFVFIMSATIIFISIFLYFFIDWRSFLNLKVISSHDANLIFMLMSIYVSICLFNSSTDALFKILDKVAIGAFILSNRRLLDIIVTLLVLFNNGGVVILAFSLVLGQILYQIFMWVYIWKCSQLNYIGFSSFSSSLLKKLLIPSISSMGFSLTQVLVNQFSVQVVYYLSHNSHLVVAFTMARTLMRLIFQFAMVVNLAMRPILSRMIGSQNYSETNAFTKKITIYVCIITVCIYFIQVFCGPYILFYWSKNTIDISSVEIAVIGFHALVNVFWYIQATKFIASNQHTKLAFIYFSGGIIACTASVFLSYFFNPFFVGAIILIIPELIAFIYIYVNLDNHKFKANLQ